MSKTIQDYIDEAGVTRGNNQLAVQYVEHELSKLPHKYKKFGETVEDRLAGTAVLDGLSVLARLDFKRADVQFSSEKMDITEVSLAVDWDMLADPKNADGDGVIKKLNDVLLEETARQIQRAISERDASGEAYTLVIGSLVRSITMISEAGSAPRMLLRTKFKLV